MEAFFFFWIGTIFKVFIKFVTILFLSYVLVVCGILAPPLEIEPTSAALEGKVLTTRPPGKFQMRL